jgi:hypothetical protein
MLHDIGLHGNVAETAWWRTGGRCPCAPRQAHQRGRIGAHVHVELAAAGPFTLVHPVLPVHEDLPQEAPLLGVGEPGPEGGGRERGIALKRPPVEDAALARVAASDVRPQRRAILRSDHDYRRG